MKASWFSREELRPWAFSATRNAFAPADTTPGGPGLEHRFSLITWNVWFDELEREARAEGLLRELAARDPDVVCLQEMTPELLKRLVASEWARRYFFSDAEGKTVDPHGVLLMSRVPFHSLVMFELPTSMERSLVIGHVTAGGAPLALGTVHLESKPDNADVRGEQLAVVLPAMREAGPDGIVCGDMNFDPDAPEAKGRFEKDFVDVWPALRGAAPGLTVDTSRNTMTAKAKGQEKQVRFDRVVLRSVERRVKPAAIEVIGTEPIGVDLFPSDHFGLQAAFTC